VSPVAESEARPGGRKIGRKIGRFRVLKELGRGAMSTVYLARDEGIGRLVALKTFRLDGAEEPEEMEALSRRLVREARSAGRLAHPNVVTIYDIIEGEGDDGFYIAMEYVQGSNLAERLAWERPISPEEILELVSAIASALDHFHSRGVIHRDIKPANILLTPNGNVKVTDFGIAWDTDPSRTQDLTILGTPQYMSPEQIQGYEVDKRSDVFALGVLLYELFTREKPFPGTTVGEVTTRILREEFIPPRQHNPELPAAVADVIAGALAKEPENRTPSAGALARALAEALGRPLPTPTVDPLAPTHRLPHGEPGAAATDGDTTAGAATAGTATRRAPRWLRLAAGLALAASLVGIGFWLAVRSAPPRGPDPGQAIYQHLLTQSQALLEADPAAAALVLSMAEPYATDPAEVRNLRAEAERRAREQGAELEFKAARKALDEGRYDRALSSARELLANEEGHEQAGKVLDELEVLLATRPPPAAGEGPSPDVADGPPPIPPDRARLTVELESQVPRGVLTLYAGERQIYREPFFFYDRKGWFRKVPRPGSLTESLDVSPGNLPIRVLVVREGEGAQNLELAATFPRGGERLLRIHLPAEGEARAEIQ